MQINENFQNIINILQCIILYVEFFYNLRMRATIGLLNIFHKYMYTSFSVLYLQLSVIIVQWLQVLEAIQGSSCQSHVKCSQSPDISTVLERKFKIHRASIKKSDLGMTLNEN